MEQRTDTLNQIFERVDGARIEQKIGKHRKMASSPFLFYRGSATLLYHDLAENRIVLPEQLFSLPLTSVMGDCHTSNFGFLTEEGSHGDKVIFSVNDFDDACIGHAVWDLFRYMGSLFLCATHCQGVVSGRFASERDVLGKQAVSHADAEKAAQAFIQGYVQICQAQINDPGTLDQVLSDFDQQPILAKRYTKAQQRAAFGSEFETNSTLAKAVDMQAKPLQFVQSDDTFLPLPLTERQEIEQTFAPYVDDHILDVVERLNAGTGSVNMSRYYLLVGPENADLSQLPLCHIVEVKKQRQAAPLMCFSNLSAVNRLNPAHLTVSCQRRMQRKPDLVLDEVVWRNEHWLVRSRHHAKVGIKPEHIGIGKKAVSRGGFTKYARTCGQALALAHCRGDKRSTLFEQAVVKILPEHLKILIDQSRAYAQQVVDDQALLQKHFSQ